MKPKRFTFDMDATVHKDIKMYCVQNNKKMRDIVHDLLKAFLQTVQKK